MTEIEVVEGGLNDALRLLTEVRLGLAEGRVNEYDLREGINGEDDLVHTLALVADDLIADLEGLRLGRLHIVVTWEEERGGDEQQD